MKERELRNTIVGLERELDSHEEVVAMLNAGLGKIKVRRRELDPGGSKSVNAKVTERLEDSGLGRRGDGDSSGSSKPTRIRGVIDMVSALQISD